MQWILDQQIKNNSRNGGLIGDESRGRKVVVDNTVKICNSCKRAWEDVNLRNHPAGFTIYPLGVIPSYGKEKQTCPSCKRKQEQQ